MKTFVLIVSEKFPSTHARAGEETHFIERIKHRMKLHTLRSNYTLWAKRVKDVNEGKAIISVRVWLGRPYNSRQLEIMQFTKASVERLEYIDMKREMAKVEGIPEISIQHLAHNDGLTPDDFRSWFAGYDRPNEMAIIHFTDFLYSTL